MLETVAVRVGRDSHRLAFEAICQHRLNSPKTLNILGNRPALQAVNQATKAKSAAGSSELRSHLPLHTAQEEIQVSRLIVVSNRVPSLTDGNCTGGLAVALNAALEERGGLWFGWSGELTDQPASEPAVTRGDAFSLATLDLSRQEFDGYYTHHANRALWPLFHSRVDLSSFDQQNYSYYRKVNSRFALALKSLVEKGDMIWVHDYHLIPLAAELRRAGVTAPIGFFLHTPFPSTETLSCLPCFREVLSELAAYDVVGFQTTACLRNFRNAAATYLHAAVLRDTISIAGRSTRTGHYPIGIDTAAFAKLAKSQAAKRWAARYRACMQDQDWIVGVERLDYTKGLAERFNAFEALLTKEEALQGRISLVQVAAPSRETVTEYRDMQARLEAISGRINGRFGTFGWTPIRYMNRQYNQLQLAALYRVAKVGLVTPLRDGMNLVAKEYVAAQDPTDPGVLVLSRFAGAAEELTDALLVNPHDVGGVVHALNRALEMPLEERQVRWRSMMRHLLEHDVHRWGHAFLEDLRKVARTAAATHEGKAMRMRLPARGKFEDQHHIGLSPGTVRLEGEKSKAGTA
jgi:trehalose 6-phosphate synthase